MAEITLGRQIAYGSGQVAGQVFRDVPSLLLLFFLTTVLGIAPAVAGLAIFVPKFVLGVGCDMAVGVFSDRWRLRFPRRWWLLVGAVGAPVAMLLLFHVPAGSESLRLGWVVAAFSLYMAVFACFSVPYLALSSDLASDSRGRTLLMAWRLVFTAVGVLTAGALAPAVVQRFGGGQPAYESMALVLAIICPVALVIAFFGSGGAATAPLAAPLAAQRFPRDRLSPRAALGVLLRPRFAVLMGANLLQLAGSGMGYAAMLYFLSYNMQRADALQLVGGIVLTMCVGIVIAQPLWVWTARRFGKIRGYVAGSLLYAAGYLAWGAFPMAPLPVIFGFALVAAIGNSGWTMNGFALLSDITADDVPHAGLYSAAWIAADKIGFALGGSLLVGLVLSGFGFDAGRAMAGQPQSALALTGVMMAFAVAPPVLNLLGAAVLGLWGREG
jgi:GPH family glycoside/pentoside/hexuronide:cation symporter